MNNLKILDVYVGGKCNLACHQCDTRSDIVGTEYDPDLETIFESITLTQKHFTIDTYSMLGGEPLLYLSKVQKVIEFIRSTDKTGRIVIPTNGSVLSKHTSELAEIIIKYNVSLYVCNHFAAFEDTKLSDKVKKETQQFAKHLGFYRYNPRMFLHEIVGDDLPHNFEDGNDLAEQEVYTNGSSYIWLRGQKEFHSNYFFSAGKPKPFMSGDPKQSYTNGCSSPSCSFLKNKKLYKCAALGTLDILLTHHNSLNDPDWSKYINYQPVDLETASLEQLTSFSNTKFSSINECDMCPSNGNYIFVKTPNKVLPIKEIK
jgi:organic radical activating enzyme